MLEVKNVKFVKTVLVVESILADIVEKFRVCESALKRSCVLNTIVFVVIADVGKRAAVKTADAELLNDICKAAVLSAIPPTITLVKRSKLKTKGWET